MDFLAQQLKMLGLNTREIRVFTTLSVLGRMKMSKLSLSSKMSRTTVDAIVRRLVIQGLISKTRIGGHFEYEVSLHDVAERLRALEHSLHSRQNGVSTPESGHVPSIIPITPSTPLIDALLTSDDLAGVFASHKGERATILLSHVANPEDRVTSLLHLFSCAREYDTKITLLTTTSVAVSLERYAPELLAHMGTHDMQLTFLPPSLCIEYTDVIAFRDTVVLVSHLSKKHVPITDEHAVQVILHLIRIAKGVGWSIDTREWLRNILDGQ